MTAIKDTKQPLLATKFYVPQLQSNAVKRAHLIDRLHRASKYKLTLISAPAGFGKTTLLSDWIANTKMPTTWVSLDKNDSDAVYFLKYIINALQALEPNAGKTALALLKSPQPPPVDSLVANLIEAFSDVRDDCALVLDDYHFIDNKEIHELFALFIDRLPSQMHIVIGTRVDPPFPLARLRARNQLLELRASDLSFTLDETALFFKSTMNLSLSSDDILKLALRTEGWIAGLQLAALSMQGRKDIHAFIKKFAGDDRHIVDYLAEEVLNLQPEQIQDFLLQTSILERLSGPLCDFVTGQKNGQAMLVGLERANLFILPLDNKRRWYRYHHLFADLLRQQLRQTHSDRLHELHRRASEWYAQNQFGEEAIEHALIAEDFKRAARLIEEISEAIWQRGEMTRLLRWIEALPDAYVFARPNLCIGYAWVLSESGKQQAAERYLQTAEKNIHTTSKGKPVKPKSESTKQFALTNRELRGRIAAIRAYIATDRGDIPGSIKFSEQALKFLHKDDSTWRAGIAISAGIANSLQGDNVLAKEAFSEAVAASKAADNINLYLAANFWLALCLKYSGQLPRAVDICQHLLKVVDEESLSQTAIEGALFGIWGEILYELNDLDEALHYVSKGLILIERGYHVGGLGWAYYGLLKILAAKNDLPGIEEIFQKIARLEQASEVPHWITHVIEAWKARVWLINGDLDRAVKWSQERELTLNDDLTPMGETEHIMFARILIAQGRPNDAIRLLDRLGKASEKGGRVLNQIEALMVKTLALRAQKNIIPALDALGKAVSLAEPGGYIRVFLDEGVHIAELLEKMLDTKVDVPRDFVKTLISNFRLNKLTKTDVGLVEKLSERELEVLRLIAAGLSNKKITEALFISMSTVKTHLRNIYSKLEAHSRTEALAKAKELNLL